MLDFTELRVHGPPRNTQCSSEMHNQFPCVMKTESQRVPERPGKCLDGIGQIWRALKTYQAVSLGAAVFHARVSFKVGRHFV